jgi:hypothetical protein
MVTDKELADIVLSLRSHVVPALTALAAGVTLGILAPLLSAVGGSMAHAASLVLSAGWTWAALAFCIGLARRSKIESSILAAASLVVAVIAYYATKMSRGDFRSADLNDRTGRATHVDWGSFTSKALVWCIAACVIGSLLGLAGNLARNHGFQGLSFRVLVPVIAIIDTSQRLRYDAPLQGPVSTTTWSVVRLLAAALILVLIGHTVITRRFHSSVRETTQK